MAIINDLYTLVEPREDMVGTDGPYSIEMMWTRSEKRLTAAVDALASNGEVSAETWVNTLIPFVSSLLVRGLQYNEYYREGLGKVEGFHVDNINVTRLFLMQRLLAPILAARWIVMHTTSPQPVITNDMGYAPLERRDDAEFGYAIPLRRDLILGIVPCAGRSIVYSTYDGTWLAMIEHEEVPPGEQVSLNRSLARFAHKSIFGPSMVSVANVVGDLRQSRVRFPELFQVKFDGVTIRQYDHDWYRLASVLALNPDDPAVADFEIAPTLIRQSAVPFLFYAFNREHWVSGLNYRPPFIDLTIADASLVQRAIDSTPNLSPGQAMHPFSDP